MRAAGRQPIPVRCQECGRTRLFVPTKKGIIKRCECGADDWRRETPQAPPPGRVSSSSLGAKSNRLGQRAPGSFDTGKRK
jgi:hypothetical protein